MTIPAGAQLAERGRWSMNSMAPILVMSLTMAFEPIPAPGPDDGGRPEVHPLLDRAREIAEGLSDTPVSPYDPAFVRSGTLLSIAERQAGAGDLEGAMKTFNAIPVGQLPPNVRLHYLIRIAALLTGAGRKDLAAERLQEARLLASYDESLTPNPVAKLTDLALALAGAGDKAAARAVARTALDRAEDLPSKTSGRMEGTDKLQALDQVARALAAAGDEAGAAFARQRALEVAEERGGGDPDARADSIAGLAQARARVGDFAEALRLLDSIEGTSDRWKVTGREIALESIAGSQSKVDIDGALRTAARITDESRRIFLLTWIARWRAEAGDWDAAEATLRAARPLVEARKQDAATAELLAKLSVAQARRGHPDAARTSIADAEAKAKGLGAGPEAASALAALARAQAAVGERETAAATLRKAGAIVARLPQQIRVIHVHADYALAAAALGDVEGALRTISSRGFGYGPADYAEPIALEAARAGDVDGARRILGDLLRAGPSQGRDIPQAAKRIAVALAREGRVETARRWADGQEPPLARVLALIGVAEELTGTPDPSRPPG